MSLRVEDLSFSYGEQEVLRSVSFCAEYGQMLSLLGPNGVGKSTLFRCMLGLLSPTRGRTELNGRSIAKMRPQELAREIAYIPQAHDPIFNYSVFDTVLMGTTAGLGTFSVPGERQRQQALQALEQLGLLHLKDRGYRTLSGGERQLVLIARALAQQARLLVMDEPSASLDFGNRLRVMQAIKALTKQGYGIVQSTHDPDQAYLYSDMILALHRGQVLAWGSPKETINAALISTLYGVQVEVCSLREDALRVCVPAEAAHSAEGI